MKRIFRKALSLLLAALLMVSIAACGQETPAAPSDSGNAPSPASPAASGGSQKDIEYWSVFTGGDGQNMQNIVDAYNATNPAVKVVHRAIEQGELYNKLPLVVQSGVDVPDLAINHVDRLVLNQENGVYAPMDEYIAANGNIKAENYLSTAWKPGEIGGKRYAIPLDVHSFYTWYNKDLVAKYAPNVLDDGVVTFDEIKEVGPKAAADGIYTYPITWARPQFVGWYAQLDKISQDGINPSINNANAVKIMNDWKEAINNKWCTQDGEDPIALFGQGKVIFLMEGTWLLTRITEMGVNFGATYSIAYNASKPLTWTSSHQFVLPKNPNLTPERGAAVMKFIEYVGENSIEWAKAGQTPASLKILENEEFKKMPQAFLLDKPENLFISDYKYYGYLLSAIDAFVYEVAFGRMDAQQGLDQAVQSVKDAIANQ